MTRRIALPLAAALAVLVPPGVYWAAGRTLVWFDTQRLYAPQRWIVDEALRRFRLPLWNPFMGAGEPLLADAIHGVLHPISIVVAWLHTGRSADLLVGGYVACAGVGAALLARELGASRVGAFAAACTFGASGYVLSMSGNLVFLAGASSIPFALAGLRRFASTGGSGGFCLAVAGVAVLAFSGDVQALMVSGALGLALAWEAGGWRGALRATAAGVVGLLVAGIQLVPSAVHLARTDRAPGTWIATPGVWALEPWRIPELVVPGLLRGADPFFDPVFAGLSRPGGWPEGNLPIPFVSSVSVGLFPAALAIAGLRAGRSGRLLWALALASLWVALGPALGAEALLGRIPVWGAFRYPEKLVGPLTLMIAVLAGLGLDAVERGEIPALAVAGVGALIGAAALASWMLSSSSLGAEPRAEAIGRALRAAPYVAAAAAALLGWSVLRKRLRPGVRGAVPAVLAWGLAAAASPMALRPGDPAARLRSPGPAPTAPAPGPRILSAFMHEPLATEDGLDWGDQAGRDHARLGYPAYNVRARVDSMSHYEAMTPRRMSMIEEAFAVRWPEAARRFAVTHVLVTSPNTDDQRMAYAIATRGGERVGPPDPRCEVWAVPHREWAFFADRVASVDGPREAIAAMARGDSRVLVETPGVLGTAAGRVLSIERDLEAVRVEAQSDADATLVIADAWWPGWEATLDGAPVSLLPADVLVRAVRWPAGRHVLAMRYDPPEVRWGALLTAVGLAVAGAGCVALRRGRGRGRGRGGPARGPAIPAPAPGAEEGAAPRPALSVVIPAFDEAAALPGHLAALVPVLERVAQGRWEIVVSDDGSTDGTGGAVAALGLPAVRVVRSEVNRGKGAALRLGVAATRGEMVLTCDADMATPPETLPAFVDALRAGADVVVGNRRCAAARIERAQPLLRRWLGSGYVALCRWSTGVEVEDINCGFKLFRGAIARALIARTEIDGWAIDLESMLLASRVGLRVVELPVVWRAGERSSVRVGADVAATARDVLRVAWRLRRAGHGRSEERR